MLQIGEHNVFRFNNPAQAARLKKLREASGESVQLPFSPLSHNPPRNTSEIDQTFSAILDGAVNEDGSEGSPGDSRAHSPLEFGMDTAEDDNSLLLKQAQEESAELLRNFFELEVYVYSEPLDTAHHISDPRHTP